MVGRHLFVLCIVLLLVGCSAMSETPSQVADQYFKAIYSGNNKLAYSYVSESDKKIKSEDQYLKELKLGPDEYNLGKTFLDLCKYKISDYKIENNIAKVNVILILPDMLRIMGDMMGNAFAVAFSGASTETMQKMMQNKFESMAKDGNMPMTEMKEALTLVREKGRWKVFLDLESQEKAKVLISEAEKLEKEKKLEGAVEKYQKVLELNSETVKAEYGKAKEKVSKLETDIKNFKEKNEYIDKVKIKNLKVGETVFGDMGVFGEIENAGNKTLKEVELTIYFLDSNGKRIYEETYHPVLISEWSIGDNKLLRSGYIEKFGYRANNAPSGWSQKIEAKITNIEFEQ